MVSLTIAGAAPPRHGFLRAFAATLLLCAPCMAAVAASLLSGTPATVQYGSVTLSWLPPTQNSNGGVLTNLAGYHIYYGPAPSRLIQKLTVSNPGLTRYVINGLGTGPWYFQLTAYNTAGVESAPTGVEGLVMP